MDSYFRTAIGIIKDKIIIDLYRINSIIIIEYITF
jgi:hypothetical protein